MYEYKTFIYNTFKCVYIFLKTSCNIIAFIKNRFKNVKNEANNAHYSKSIAMVVSKHVSNW